MLAPVMRALMRRQHTLIQRSLSVTAMGSLLSSLASAQHAHVKRASCAAEAARNDFENYTVGSPWQLRAHVACATAAVMSAFARHGVSPAAAMTATANGRSNAHIANNNTGTALDHESAEILLTARERALAGMRDVSLRVRLVAAARLDTLLRCVCTKGLSCVCLLAACPFNKWTDSSKTSVRLVNNVLNVCAQRKHASSSGCIRALVMMRANLPCTHEGVLSASSATTQLAQLLYVGACAGIRRQPSPSACAARACSCRCLVSLLRCTAPAAALRAHAPPQVCLISAFASLHSACRHVRMSKQALDWQLHCAGSSNFTCSVHRSTRID